MGHRERLEQRVKKEGAIKHKLRQVRTRHLHKLLDASLRQRPHNCALNEIRAGDADQEVHICLKDMTLCDSHFGGEREGTGIVLSLPLRKRRLFSKRNFRSLFSLRPVQKSPFVIQIWPH